MKFDRLSLISIIATAIFVLLLLVFSQDVTLAGDGEVPGTPFQYLQEQIDNLHQQINDIQTNIVKAYVTKNFIAEILPGDYVDVLELNLPEGFFINTVIMQASYRNDDGTFDPIKHSFLSCEVEDAVGTPVSGSFGGVVIGTETHAKTFELELTEQMDIMIKCEVFAEENGQKVTINNIVWTAIKVDELDRQNIGE